MMSEARTAILNRLRAAQRTGSIPAIPRAVEIPEAPPRSAGECLSRFIQELTALGVEHYVEDSSAAVWARVSQLVRGKRVLAWSGAQLPYNVGTAAAEAIQGGHPRSELEAAEIGLTGCSAAIAETGTLVMLSGVGRPRVASLLPPVHLAVVRRTDLYFGMTEFMRDRARDVGGVTNCTFITGPSRTADIELTLTIGVHGPGKVVVIVGP